MTERGLPIVDGAPACPFVAFEDDREERATSPDQRHRCYAEPRPAPRAQAHQDAYCLSSAFPTCPTFQEWARREAARVQEDAPRANPLVDLPPQRNPNRGWAAPPPWMGPGQRATGPVEDSPDRLVAAGPGEVGLAGSLAHRIALEGGAGAAFPPPTAEADPAPIQRTSTSAFGPGRGDGSEPTLRRPELPPAQTAQPLDDAWPLEPAPREPSAREPAAREPGPREPGPREPAPSLRAPITPDESIMRRTYDDVEIDDEEPLASAIEPYPPDVARWARPDFRDAPGGDPEDDERGPFGEPDEVAYEPRRVPSRPAQPAALARVGSLLPGDHRPKVGDTRPRRRAGEMHGPAWERPRRYEAYPTIRTRIGLPAVPRVGLLAVALLLAAVGLFFLPTLLGVGNPAGSPGPSGSAARTGGPSASAGSSLAAAPTPQVYEVAPGDTMSKIAGKFGVALADLVAANKDTYPNPDKIAIGDLIVIPTPPPSGFVDSRTQAPAATPTRAPATRTPTPTRR